MPLENPYDQLGRILAEGGDAALGMAIYNDWSPARLALLASRKFSGIDKQQMAVLQEAAQAGLDAGVYLTDLAEGSDIDIRQIPVNEYLFGEDKAGRRMRFIGEWQFEGSEQWYRTDLDYPDTPSIEELREDIADRGGSIGSKYPEKFGLDPNSPPVVSNIRITFSNRAF